MGNHAVIVKMWGKSLQHNSVMGCAGKPRMLKDQISCGIGLPVHNNTSVLLPQWVGRLDKWQRFRFRTEFTEPGL